MPAAIAPGNRFAKVPRSTSTTCPAATSLTSKTGANVERSSVPRSTTDHAATEVIALSTDWFDPYVAVSR